MPSSTTFVALYRGRTVSDARLVAASADPDLVARVVERLLGEPTRPERDPALNRLDEGRRQALRVIAGQLT